SSLPLAEGLPEREIRRVLSASKNATLTCPEAGHSKPVSCRRAVGTRPSAEPSSRSVDSCSPTVLHAVTSNPQPINTDRARRGIDILPPFVHGEDLGLSLGFWVL